MSATTEGTDRDSYPEWHHLFVNVLEAGSEGVTLTRAVHL